MKAAENPARAEALAWLSTADAAQQGDRAVAPYLEAAAVLSTFTPSRLRPTASGPDLGQDALFELIDRAFPVGAPELDVWQLEDGPRRSALRRLGSRPAMRAARALNTPAKADPLQEAIDRLISDEAPPKLEALSLDGLLALDRAARWFEGVLEGLPAGPELLALIERERQLAPMRRIAGEGFVDREDFLERLEEYVGVMPSRSLWSNIRKTLKQVVYSFDERPPLHFHGPGGIGKSALLAHFILDHADPARPEPLPFVYLDFDRSALDPRSPETLLDDAIRQLLIEFPAVDPELFALREESVEHAQRVDNVEVGKSLHLRDQDELVGRFCRLLEVIAAQNDEPVLLVLDTLEEAEFQGLSALQVTWDLLRTLLRRVERLRIVTAGRSPLPAILPREPLELTGLPVEAAVELLTRKTANLPGGPISADDARAIVGLVGPVPLSLMLGARVVLREGLEGLRSTVGRQALFAKIKSEQQQGLLYRRILGHVRAHDPELEKLVNPGLILRRITPEIIEKVLAEPCGLEIKGPWHAEKLFEALARETGLVDPYREPGALWHLQPVRRIMLPELRLNLGSVATAIDQAAVRFYRKDSEQSSKRPPNPADQAEELYHRLWLGDDDAAALDALWQPAMVGSLRSAFEDLEPGAKVWLGDKLGIELDAALRSRAGDKIWERQAEQRARTLLGRGLASEALAALRERPRAGASPLFALEADALKLLGRSAEALEVARRGLAAAEGVGDYGTALPLMLRQVFLLEAAGAFAEALPLARKAAELARRLMERLEWLSAGVAILRLLRKLGRLGEGEEIDGAVQAEMATLVEDKIVRGELRSRPTLLQEAAAELGLRKVDLLEEAVSLLGISPEDQLALLRHVQQAPASGNARRVVDELEKRSTSRGAGHSIAYLVPDFPEFFVERLAQKVDDSLRLSVASAAENTRGLPADALSELATLITRDFSPKDLDLLAFDTFERKLEEIVASKQTFDRQVRELLTFAQKHPAGRTFLMRVARSRPSNGPLYQAAQRLAGTSPL